MQKRIISILCLLIVLQFSAFGRKSHKAHGKKTSHKSAKKSRKNKKSHKGKKKTYKAKITQPTITVEEVKSQDNLWGIDISHHQSDIDWVKLNEHKPGFVFIKATEGVTLQDSKYQTNYDEAKKQGIVVGSYHFFSYQTPGVEQAKNFLSVAQHSNGDLLPVLDAEFRREMPAKDLVTNELTDFIYAIYERLGYYPIVYCNYKFYKMYLEEHLPKQCKLWIVDYQKKPDCDWTLWQITDRFKLDGIRGFVDLNFFNGTKNQFKSLLFNNHLLY